METESTSAHSLESKEKIAKRLKRLYDDHEFNVKQEAVITIVENLNKIIFDRNIDKFFNSVEMGELGILYKAPTCIMVMAQKFRSEVQNNQRGRFVNDGKGFKQVYD